MDYKKYIIAILLFSFLAIKGQDFDYTPVIFELLPIHPHAIIDQQGSEFSIEQYKKADNNDTVIFIGGLFFKKINDTIFQTRLYKKINNFKKKEYWKFNKNNNIQQCKIDGSVKEKWVYNGFDTFEYQIEKEDSIIDKIEWIKQKDGNHCHFLDRWIYRDKKLIEKWHLGPFSINSCTWVGNDNITFKKIQYPDNNTTITEVFRGSISKRTKTNEYKIVKIYNKIGQLVSEEFYNKENYETPRNTYKYYYKNNQWLRTEYWVDGELTEVIKIKN